MAAELAKMAIDEVDKLRDQTHQLEISAAIQSEAMKTFTNNMELIFDILKKQSEELELLKKVFDNKTTVKETLLKVVKYSYPFIVVIFAYIIFTFEKQKIVQFIDYIKGFFL